MSFPRAFKSFDEFEREIIRPSQSLGLSLEEMVEDSAFEGEPDFDADPFAEMKDD